MGMNKRDFLKVSGLAVLGAGVAPQKGEAATGHGDAHGDAKEPSGPRLAMIVDLTKEHDWSACVEACHTAHNVPDFVDNKVDPSVNNKKHEIKWFWTEPYANAFGVNHDDLPYLDDKIAQLSLPVLCNHCENPPCVRACPTQATFKRPDGIVIMDFHRCIGCRFCMAACPYGSRSFNLKDPRLGLKDDKAKGGWKATNPDFPTRMKGVVEKCNFCAERIAVGKKPACVDVAPKGAMFFGDLNDPEQQKEGGVAWLLKHNYTIKHRR